MLTTVDVQFLVRELMAIASHLDVWGRTCEEATRCGDNISGDRTILYGKRDPWYECHGCPALSPFAKQAHATDKAFQVHGSSRKEPRGALDVFPCVLAVS